MFEEAAHWLAGQVQTHLAVPVTYVTRDGREYPVKAVMGKTLFQSQDSYGMTVTSESRDFIVSSGELPFEPQRGDAILRNSTRYEILAPSGEPCWRWCDACQTMKRIHTKEA